MIYNATIIISCKIMGLIPLANCYSSRSFTYQSSFPAFQQDYKLWCFAKISVNLPTHNEG